MPTAMLSPASSLQQLRHTSTTQASLPPVDFRNSVQSSWPTRFNTQSRAANNLSRLSSRQLRPAALATRPWASPLLEASHMPYRSHLVRSSNTATAPEAGVEKGAASADVIADLSKYLETELPKLFLPGGMKSEGRFEDKVAFVDPITRYDTLQGYLFNIAMLRVLFTPTFQLHSVYQTGPAEVTTRWTMRMNFRILPWQPEVVFTGLSIYGINPETGKFKSHKDVWDSIQDNGYFSREGLVDLLKQCGQLYRPPQSLGSPPFESLLRRASYEVRSYDPYSAVQVQCSEGLKSVAKTGGDQGPLSALKNWAASTTSNRSLGYPLMWVVTGADNGGTPEVQLRRPAFGGLGGGGGGGAEDSVAVVNLPQQYVAISTFSGAPSLDRFEAAESLLRSSLLQDGLTPALPVGSYSAVTYTEGQQLPALIRNEVHLLLEGFTWP